MCNPFKKLRERENKIIEDMRVMREYAVNWQAFQNYCKTNARLQEYYQETFEFASSVGIHGDCAIMMATIDKLMNIIDKEKNQK